MKSKATRSLIICLILTVSYLSPVHAVTDAELEALEKQIEQLESEEKKQTEAAEKKKTEAEAKQNAEVETEKRRRVELEKQRQDEQRRFAELERKRQEEEARKRAEEENKEKYTLLIAEAGQAVRNKDKELAISKYNEVLVLYPRDRVAISGIKEAEKLMDKFCYMLIGEWKQPAWGGDTVNFFEDGVVSFKSTIVSYQNTWECHPERREISMDILNNVKNAKIYSFKLSSDGRKLYFVSYGEQLYLEKIDAAVNKENNKTVTNVDKSGFCSKNTWDKKIKIKEDYKQLQSVGLLGEKLIANKISDDPYEKIVPVQKSRPSIPGY